MSIARKSLLLLTVSILTLCQAYAQADRALNIPLNKYGLPVVNSFSLYQQLVAADSNQALVSLRSYIPNIRTDIRYATANNFTHQVLYPREGAYLRLAAARALKGVQQELNSRGLGLKIFDGYRPYRITEKMWEVVPDDRYAADPKVGSGHNRGVAVDLTIIDLRTGRELPMPTGFDDFTEKAHHNYPVADTTVAANRKLLRSIMEKHGFTALETEWWHYSLKDYRLYPLMDIPFEALP